MTVVETAPYQRIAGDIRERIADGRLAPGDRVPSTRRLAKEWGVALATATKAMTLLCQEGVLESRPRSGTVVAGAPGRQPVAEGELTRERVVRAAIAIADAEGLDGLSMRAVAARLGVATMSTYRHVPGKEDLLLLMADAAFGEVTHPPPGATDDWRASVEGGCRALWSVFRAHPWLAHVTPLTRPLPLRGLLAHAEQLHRGLDHLGLDGAARLDLLVMLFGHVQGLAAQLGREAAARAETGLTEQQSLDRHGAAFGEILAEGRFPGYGAMLGGLGPDGYDLDLDRIFELGLRTLLDGLATLPGTRRRA